MKLALVLLDLEKIPHETYAHFMEIVYENTLFVANGQPGSSKDWVVNRNRYSDATITQLLSPDMVMAILKETLTGAVTSESQQK